jgi:hypothetical protein
MVDSLMDLLFFSLRLILRHEAWRTAKVFRISVAAEWFDGAHHPSRTTLSEVEGLAVFALAKNPQTASPSQDCPVKIILLLSRLSGYC